jgi:hypothetical protein
VLLLLGSEVVRLDYPGHYRVRDSHLGGPSCVWSGLSAPDEAMYKGGYQDNVGDVPTASIIALGSASRGAKSVL